MFMILKNLKILYTMSSIPKSTAQAITNRYMRMDGNCSPSAINGRVNRGINPNVEEDNIPYKKPFRVLLFISLANQNLVKDTEYLLIIDSTVGRVGRFLFI